MLVEWDKILKTEGREVFLCNFLKETFIEYLKGIFFLQNLCQRFTLKYPLWAKRNYELQIML